MRCITRTVVAAVHNFVKDERVAVMRDGGVIDIRVVVKANKRFVEDSRGDKWHPTGSEAYPKPKFYQWLRIRPLTDALCRTYRRKEMTTHIRDADLASLSDDSLENVYQAVVDTTNKRGRV